jgi:hypothetical protein
MEDKKFTVTLVKFDTVNLNNRCYSMESFKKAVEQYQKQIDSSRAYGTVGYSDFLGTDIRKVSHIVESISVDDTEAYATIKLLDTPAGIEASKMISEGTVVLRPYGTGKVNESGYVTDYTLFGTALILNTEDSWKVQ